jgi:hypothetical protein
MQILGTWWRERGAGLADMLGVGSVAPDGVRAAAADGVR